MSELTPEGLEILERLKRWSDSHLQDFLKRAEGIFKQQDFLFVIYGIAPEDHSESLYYAGPFFTHEEAVDFFKDDCPWSHYMDVRRLSQLEFLLSVEMKEVADE